MKKSSIVIIIGVIVVGIIILGRPIPVDKIEIDSPEQTTEFTNNAMERNPESSSVNNCDSSYPDVCIPPYPPDLNCGEISFSNFRVIGNDLHGFVGASAIRL